jgi:hypothetical protein
MAKAKWIPLQYSAGLYLVGLIAHTLDHIRRGTGLITPEVFWAGMVSTAAGVITVFLVYTRHRWAPAVAAVFGLPVALGVAAVHFLPSWGVLSDPFPGGGVRGVTGVSWIVVSVEIAGALALSFSGIRALAQPINPTATKAINNATSQS